MTQDSNPEAQNPIEALQSIDPACARLLEDASAMLARGCADLRESTGLEFEPDYLAHALRVPELAAAVCFGIDKACLSLSDPKRMAQAKLAVDAICSSAKALRIAVGMVAASQGANNRAISAYAENL